MLPLIAVLTAAIDSTHFVRVNQVGYLPDAPKAAVVCALDGTRLGRYHVEDERGRVVLRERASTSAGALGPCATTERLDFSAVRAPGRYVIVAGADVRSPVVRVGADVYAGGADTLLYYLRQQRSGFNPFFRDSVHRHDGNVVDDSGR